MKRTRRIASWLARGVLGFLILAFLILWVIFATTAGSRYVISQAERFMDGQLLIEEVDGSLAGPLTLRGVRFANDAVVVELEEVSLDWLPSVLLFSDALVHVEHLHLNDLQVTLLGRAAEIQESQPLETALPEPLTLPVSLRIDELELTHAAFHQADRTISAPDELIRLDRVAGSDLLWDEAGIDLPQLLVRSPEVDFVASGDLNPKGDWPVNLDASYTFRLSSYQLPDLSARTLINGSLKALLIDQRIESPYALDATINVNDVLVNPAWDARVQVLGTHLKEIQQNLPDVMLEAGITAQGDASHASLIVDSSAAQTSLRVEGDITFAGSPSGEPIIDLELDWQDFLWPLDSGQLYTLASTRGHAEVKGQLDDYQMLVAADLLLPDYPAGSLNISGVGTPTLFDVQTLELSVLGGLVRGLAQVQWQDGLVANFDLGGTGLDTTGILPDWPGQIDFAVQGDVALAANASPKDAHVNLTQLVVDGVLLEKPVNAKIVGTYADARLVLPSLFITTLDTTLQADGTVALSDSGRTDFNWQFSLDDLSLWQEDALGSVQASGHLSGNLRQPRLLVKAVLNNIELDTLKVDNAELAADLGLDQLPLSLQVVAQDVDVAEMSVQSMMLSLEGKPVEHTFAVSMVSDAGEAELAGRGVLNAVPGDGMLASAAQWQDATWQFSMDTLNLAQKGLVLELLPVDERSISTATLSGASFALAPTCLGLSASDRQNSNGSDLQKLCIQASGSYTENITTEATLDNVSLNLLDALLPEDLGLVGRINGMLSADVDLASGSAQADLALTTSATRLTKLDTPPDSQTLLQFAPGNLVGSLRDDVLLLDVVLPRTDEEGITANIRLAAAQGEGFAARTVDGSVVAKLSDIEWLAEFVPGVSQITGVFDSNLRVSGTIAEPNLIGDLMLSNASATLPEPGLKLRNIELSLLGGGNNDLTLKGSATSGRGELSLAGELQDIGPSMRGRVDVSGNRFLVLYTPEAKIISSPEVTVQLVDGKVDISGEILIDEAEIELNTLPQTAVSVSDDQVIVSPETATPAAGESLQVTTRLRLKLNDAVEFEGFGLKSTFTGGLDIVDTPNEPTTAQGEIRVVEGRYRAYGQDLTIERGRLLFVGGPIEQPGLDVRAVRQATPDVKVGVIARGSLRAPEFSIFSTPSMSQSNQLAYLVLGRPLNEGTTSETSALSRAALALGIQGGNYLTEQFGDRLGVDNIGIEAPDGETNEQASLVVGKYLSPKLYVSYGIGILDAIDTLKIEYILSSKWRLTSESSTEESGADFTYTLER